MRIAMISDCAAPTSPRYPGHGLGQAVWRTAVALAKRGHHVHMFAGGGSEFEQGELTTVHLGNYNQEILLAKAVINAHQRTLHPFDVFIDNTHTKVMSTLYPHYPIVSVYHDRWMEGHGKNPVLVSEGMRALMDDRFVNAPVITHYVDPADYPFAAEPIQPPYALFCGIWRDYKNPMLAVQACALAGIPLIVMGTIPATASPFGEYSSVHYIGAKFGVEKADVMQGASVYLQLGSSESFGLTTVEAGLCGTPTVALARGGSIDIIQYGLGIEPLNGVFVQSSRNMAQSVADSIGAAMVLDRRKVREAAAHFCDAGAHVLAWESLLEGIVDDGS